MTETSCHGMIEGCHCQESQNSDRLDAAVESALAAKSLRKIKSSVKTFPGMGWAMQQARFFFLFETGTKTIGNSNHFSTSLSRPNPFVS